MQKLIAALAAAATAAALALPAVTAAPALAEDNGVDLTPALGWSSWSFLRSDPTAAKIEASADAMVSSGLAAAGFRYINLDDFYYLCPGSQGPDVDQYGRWVTDPAKFPPGPGGENGIKAVADYVHAKGLKFGLYVTPGISRQAVAQNTPIEGTPYHADDIATTTPENNYNCGGMVGIDYSRPGAQAFINSWADEMASWGVDYLKIDGVGTSDIPDIQAWSQALKQTGRPIHLELSNSLSMSGAATWKQLANGWRTGGDVECYCGPGGSSYPLTDWANVSARFDQVAAWQPYGGPGAFNDYDSLEVGNGANDGLTPDERKTQMSLWALAASPLILGTDLTSLDPADLALLTNTDVLSVDQDAIDAARISDTASQQVFTKTEPDGTVVAGLFNTSGQAEPITMTASALGLPGGSDYLVSDLWSHQTTESAGAIAPVVPSHGVALYRIRPLHNPAQAPPNTSCSVSGPAGLAGGQPSRYTASFTNHGELPARKVTLSLLAPSGWTVTPVSARSFPAVTTGKTVTATFAVTAPAPGGLFQSGTLSARAAYGWPRGTGLTTAASEDVSVSPPVQQPYQTYSSATDAPALFAQSGGQLGITGGGADLFSDSDSYSTIYLPGSVGISSAIDTTVDSQQNLTGFGKSGIIVRNDMTGSGSTPEGVILFASPEGGIQLEWASSGGMDIDSVTPANGTIGQILPVHLKLERTSADSYTGYYSFDGQGWYQAGTATVPGQAGTQDAGVFVTSHSTGTQATAVFGGLSVTAGAAPPPPGPAPYEAEAPGSILAGGAGVTACDSCSGGQKVGFIGEGGTLTVTGVSAPAAGDYQVTLAYLDGSAGTGRQFVVSADGGPAQTVQVTPTGSFSTVGLITITLHLNAGANTIEFSNPDAFAPDLDRILVAAAPQ